MGQRSLAEFLRLSANLLKTYLHQCLEFEIDRGKVLLI